MNKTHNNQRSAIPGQYPGAPYLAEILGCFYDIEAGYRWCEVDDDSCDAEVIYGKDRSIHWQKCVPASCDVCSCDCTPKCTAYNIIPEEGRLPPQVEPRGVWGGAMLTKTMCICVRECVCVCAYVDVM